MKRREILGKAVSAATLRQIRTEQRHYEAVSRYATLDASVTETAAEIEAKDAMAKACLHPGRYSKAAYADVLARQAQALHALAALRLELECLVGRRADAGAEAANAGRARARAVKKSGRIEQIRRATALADQNAADRSEIEDLVEIKSYVQ
ncbi:hypothetical protein OVY01_08225 [Robbsia sp. Bb-Pol-6]|uniref:Uncharacterized protein n=1 Tax=Robbsia betulipollinis TaxID=2981849 RepID=A0ABT3ZL05_9BURK|nr:hypothetical protein [Robbsia betulipollinis]MCY0387218.1 hypothetical protein [Robbsia betulipollinis]